MISLQTVIMAGGKGTRIAAYYPDLSKPMIPLCGKPVLQHQVECAVRQGLTRITIVTGYRAEDITGYFGDGTVFGAEIHYIHEDMPLGTGGALAQLPKEDTLLLFGDIYFQVDLHRFIAYHQQKKATVTLFVHPNDHPADSDLVVTDDDGRVSGWMFKNTPRAENLRNVVNAGLYVLSADFLPRTTGQKLDLDRNLIATAIPDRKVCAYRSTEYVKDMGTPGRLEAVSRDIQTGTAAARMLANRQRAVFFDRDGVLNRFDGLIASPEQLVLLPGAREAVAAVNGSQYLAICVTNQPVVARGLTNLSGLDAIHGRLDTLLAEGGAYLDDLLFCPHHPDKGYPGEVAEYKTDCACRKPKPGMLTEAARRYNIDLSASVMIGDTTWDIAAGRAAGCTTIGVRTGEGLADGRLDILPDHCAADAYEAVRWMLARQKR